MKSHHFWLNETLQLGAGGLATDTLSQSTVGGEES